MHENQEEQAAQQAVVTAAAAAQAAVPAAVPAAAPAAVPKSFAYKENATETLVNACECLVVCYMCACILTDTI